MKTRKIRFWKLRELLPVYASALLACNGLAGGTGPEIQFKGKFGQVEVGGPFAGAEFHGSRPLPSRISFYYPVANSIDLSTDYWKRGESRPMVVGVAVDGGRRHWVGKEGWDYVLSPHKVQFTHSEDGLDYQMSYEFCLTQPAMVFRLSIRNTAARAVRLEAYTHLKTSLRTCQTYARLDSASTTLSADSAGLMARFPQREAGKSCVIVGNGAARPASWTTDAVELGIADSGVSRWVQSGMPRDRTLFTNGRRGNAAAAFVYEQRLEPGDSLSVVQYIASSRLEEADSVDRRLAETWHSEIAAYDKYVRKKAFEESTIRTGDAAVDSSVSWAHAILAANAHYLDGVVVPMPCPAEYNFFFTHDVLLTDLAAVNFDPDRVRRDLLYIMSLSKGDIIPHAYYWRDDGFKTEMCTPDNWNHLWFILLNGSYLRHTGDTSTVSRLYPLITKSLTEIMQQQGPDGLMHAFRPDWWDIGRNEGPRSFITILMIRALREYQFISSYLGRNLEMLVDYEQTADAMQKALVSRLWDEKLGYLINFNGEKKDTHYYMGSLLAPAFRLLQSDKGRRMMESATRELVAPNVGVRTVFPVDFNTDSVRAFFKFVGNEAGDPYVYANGGVWPHCNAWYALGLQSTGSADEALRFFREIMTLQGVTHGPMGQPAMYEYRFSDPTSPEYGKVDKPSFLWAGGFYLYTLYHLLGVSESPWNISVGVDVPRDFASVSFDDWFSGEKHVTQTGSAKDLHAFRADGSTVFSRIVPLDLRQTRRWEIELGPPKAPYLQEVDAIVRSVRMDSSKQSLTVQLQSFAGHGTSACIVSPRRVTRILLDGKLLDSSVVLDSRVDGALEYRCWISGSNGIQQLEVYF